MFVANLYGLDPLSISILFETQIAISSYLILKIIFHIYLGINRICLLKVRLYSIRYLNDCVIIIMDFFS